MSRITTGLPLVYRPDKAHVWVEDAPEVAAYARSRAVLCEWQVAAAHVIASWRDMFQSDFPSHPTRVVAHDGPSTLGFLQSLQWYAAVVGRAGAITASGEPAAALATAHADVSAWLASAEWNTRFPGKQIFRDVRGYIYDPAALGAPSTGIQPDIDVAVAVAVWQRSNGRVPAELQTLQSVVHAKSGV